jgi:hypothetical protein
MRPSRPKGIFVNPFERGEIGPDLFRAACRMDFNQLIRYELAHSALNFR